MKFGPKSQLIKLASSSMTDMDANRLAYEEMLGQENDVHARATSLKVEHKQDRGSYTLIS
jgi:hypothetical protein